MGAKKKSDKTVYQQQVPIVYGARHPPATVATINTKGMMSTSYKGKLKPVASPQPPPDYHQPAVIFESWSTSSATITIK